MKGLSKKIQKDFTSYFNDSKDNFSNSEIVGSYVQGMRPGEGATAGDLYEEAELIRDTETMDLIDNLETLASELRGNRVRGGRR